MRFVARTFLRSLRRAAAIAVVLSLGAALGLTIYGAAKSHPQDLPWTRLDLAQPIGLFTGRKLVGLTHHARACEQMLTAAGVRFEALPTVKGEGECGYADGVRLMPGGALEVPYAPAANVSCPVAAALSLWQWNVVAPAVESHFPGAHLTAIEHYGSYACRRMYSRASGAWSEHATADAIDIAAFRLSDGTRILVSRDWNAPDARGDFLREVRNGACKLFATVLSPDYNAEHHDHLHLDEAERGEFTWRACR